MNRVAEFVGGPFGGNKMNLIVYQTNLKLGFQIMMCSGSAVRELYRWDGKVFRHVPKEPQKSNVLDGLKDLLVKLSPVNKFSRPYVEKIKAKIKFLESR